MSDDSIAATTGPHSARLAACVERARALGVDHLVLTPGDDLAYLLGTRLETHERLTALVVPVEAVEPPLLVLPSLEVTASARQAAARVGAVVVPWVDGSDPVELVADAVRDAQVLAVSDSCEARHLLPLQSRLWTLSATGPVLLVHAGDVVDAVRSVKSTEEVWQLSDAAARIDAVHRRMGEFLRVGRTEADVAAHIERAIVEEGLTHAEFVIVGSGPHGADPHHAVSDRVVAAGDVVVVDIGGPVAAGYHSDCTRTYSMGEPGPEVAQAYAHLEHAQRTAREVVRPGVPIGDVDAAARGVLDDAGLGEYFTHRTGHGIGLGLHERPFAAPGDTTVLQEGMTFSIEPGIYLPGRWGARVEDIVVVTADGCLPLNDAPRGLTVLDA